MKIQTRILPDPAGTAGMNTTALRASFLVEGLFKRGEARLVYTSLDRMIVGSVVPGGEPLELTGGKELASRQFAERREVGVLNLGAPGRVAVDGQTFAMSPRDGLYIGRGAGRIAFESDRAGDPARFYVVSLPAHTSYPTVCIERDQANPVQLGSAAGASRRTIYQYIHSGGVQSCQLVMGITSLAEGSVWNTMPAHTHPRRVEAYLYFDTASDGVVFHLMGSPDETRHLVVRDGEAVLSPSWSIHSGCGTGSYSFVWAMGGENQDFNDMDAVGMDELR